MEIIQTEAVQLEVLEEIQEVQDLEVEALPEIPEQIRPLFMVGGISFGGKFVGVAVAALVVGLFAPWVFAQGEIGSLYSQKEINISNEMSSREAQLAPIKEKIQELSQK